MSNIKKIERKRKKFINKEYANNSIYKACYYNIEYIIETWLRNHEHQILHTYDHLL